MPLPVAYRSLSRPSSAPDAKAFPLRSFQLDLVAQALLAPCHVRVGRSSAPASRPLAKCRWASPSLFLPCGPVHRSLCVYAHVSGSQELCRHNLTEESSAFVAFTLLKFPQRAVTFALGALLAVLSLSLAKMPLSFAQPVFALALLQVRRRAYAHASFFCCLLSHFWNVFLRCSVFKVQPSGL